jgi:hypothetical protein
MECLSYSSAIRVLGDRRKPERRCFVREHPIDSAGRHTWFGDRKTTLGYIAFSSLLAVKLRVARTPDDVSVRQFLGAACLCGVGDTVALLMADQAFPAGPDSAIAKIGVLPGSVFAAALGALILANNSDKPISFAADSTTSGSSALRLGSLV